VGIENLAETSSATLSLGNLRRLEIARALALEPKLLLLDESFSGLSQEEIGKMMKLVETIRDRGISVLLIEHNMRVAMTLCRRLVVLDHGQKLAEGPPEEIRSDERVIEAYLGKGASGNA
jgi:ABC-type branched-subunit amino acid transport system ATPase component